MTGLEIYLLVSPFILLAVAGAMTWLLVGRKNAPLGTKANKISLGTSRFQTATQGVPLGAAQDSVPPRPFTLMEEKATHKAPPLPQ